MSVQNSLKRPTFSKSVMGYAQVEVEKYIDHVTERYNSVCRENAELKRRVMALGVRIDEATERIDELERERSQAPSAAEDGARYSALELEGLIISLENEKRRSEAAITEIQDKLRRLASESAGSVDETSADDTWEALGKFILEASADLPEVEEKTVSEVRTVEISDVPLPEIVLDEKAQIPSPIVPASLLLPEAKPALTEGEKAPEARVKTPLEIADELDFYPPEEEEDETEPGKEYDSIEDEAWKKMLADLIAAAPLEAELEGESEEADELDFFVTKNEESAAEEVPELIEDDSWKKMLAELIAIAPTEDETESADEDVSEEETVETEAEAAPEAEDIPVEAPEAEEIEEVEETEQSPETPEAEEAEKSEKTALELDFYPAGMNASDYDESWKTTLAELIEVAPASEASAEAESAEEIKADEPETEPVIEFEEFGAEAENEAPKAPKSAREIADELDFYSDDVHADGESFDPMTLAAKATEKKRRPKLEDFMSSRHKKN